MIRSSRTWLGLFVSCAVVLQVRADGPDLSDYRTVEKAIVARPTKPGPATSVRPAFLGVSVAADGEGRLTAAEVATDSPAARAGVQRGDWLRLVDGKELKAEGAFHDLLRAKAPGDAITLGLSRQQKSLEVKATLAALSAPLSTVRQRAVLGVQVATRKDAEGVTIEQVTPGSAADKAKLRAGEVLLRVNDVAVTGESKLRELLADKKPDDSVTLTLFLAEKAVDLKVKLGGEQVVEGRPAGWEGRGASYWTKPTYRVAIICVEYPDAKHNDKIPPKAWEEAMFSKSEYTKTSVTGQTVYGSMFDYYWEQSYNHLTVEGKAFDYVEMSKKRGDYATGDRTALLREALDKILERDGKDALKDFDGVFYIYAGDRYPAPRGSLYWPHRASVRHNGKNWPYFICPEGGARMGNISVFCHEFGHMLGLPDLYARPENPGMEGVGVWCAMSNQVGNGRPQHFCAWSKEKLGWIKPTVLDPAVKQKLILSPIEDDAKQCFKILVKPDGSEYFLLENRRKKGFDSSLPADGLLIWRVVGNRPILEESHGVEGPSGPRVYLNSVPYPSAANDALTPFTTPSSRSQLGNGPPIYITNIRRLDDGRITFHIGYEYQ